MVYDHPMTNRPTKPCRYCGAMFTMSRTDSTVHCPAHRDPASRKVVTTPARKPAFVYNATKAVAVPAGATCTIGGASRKCGKPAVYAFTGRDGHVYYECKEHVR